MSLTVILPIRTTTESNAKGHWRPKAKRAKEQRSLTGLVMLQPIRKAGYRDVLKRSGQLLITLTRIAPQRLDVDNNVSSMKHVIDGIADALGIDDRTTLIDWRFSQRKGKPKEYAVEVVIEERQT